MSGRDAPVDIRKFKKYGIQRHPMLHKLRRPRHFLPLTAVVVAIYLIVASFHYDSLVGGDKHTYSPADYAVAVFGLASAVADGTAIRYYEHEQPGTSTGDRATIQRLSSTPVVLPGGKLDSVTTIRVTAHGIGHDIVLPSSKVSSISAASSSATHMDPLRPHQSYALLGFYGDFGSIINRLKVTDSTHYTNERGLQDLIWPWDNTQLSPPDIQNTEFWQERFGDQAQAWDTLVGTLLERVTFVEVG